MLLKKSEIRKLVRNEGFRISPESYDGINRAVENTIKQMLVQVSNDNMKTLMAQHTDSTYANVESPKTDQPKQKEVYGCQRCGNIKATYIRWARNVQQFCADEAMIMLNKLGGK